jgi:hypothetical protein
MSSPAVIASQDHADEFVDDLMDELFGATGSGSDEQDQDEDSTAADTTPPNFWLGPINTGPVSFGKPVDDPVTSGSDGIGNAAGGTVDSGPSQ